MHADKNSFLCGSYERLDCSNQISHCQRLVNLSSFLSLSSNFSFYYFKRMNLNYAKFNSIVPWMSIILPTEFYITNWKLDPIGLHNFPWNKLWGEISKPDPLKKK